MKQDWYLVFSETGVFKKRYIKLHDTSDGCRRFMLESGLNGLITAVIAERDFAASDFVGRGYKEIDIETIQ